MRGRFGSEAGISQQPIDAENLRVLSALFPFSERIDAETWFDCTAWPRWSWPFSYV